MGSTTVVLELVVAHATNCHTHLVALLCSARSSSTTDRQIETSIQTNNAPSRTHTHTHVNSAHAERIFRWKMATDTISIYTRVWTHTHTHKQLFTTLVEWAKNDFSNGLPQPPPPSPTAEKVAIQRPIICLVWVLTPKSNVCLCVHTSMKVKRRKTIYGSVGAASATSWGAIFEQFCLFTFRKCVVQKKKRCTN